MSNKQAKRLKRVMRRQMGRQTSLLMDGLLDCGFLFRLKIAWQIIKGKKKHEKTTY